MLRKCLILVVFVCCVSPAPGEERTVEIQAHIQRARAALAQHDLQRASEEYSEILRLDPRNVEVNEAQGVVLYGLGKPREAAALLQTALQLDPNQTTAELFLGLSRSDFGQCNEAVPLLRKHFDAQTDAKLRRLVGLSLLNCYARPTQVDQAIDVAQALRKSYPDDPDVLYNLAELYTRLWDATATDLLKNHPESYRVHQLAGEVLEAQGKADQAVKEYRLALKDNNKIPRLHYRIGRLTSQEGGPAAEEQALAYFQQELTVNPGYAPPEYSIAEIYRQKRQFAQAEEHFRRALELAPDLAEARVGLAKTFLAEQRTEKAREEVETAIRLRPDDPAAHYTLMIVYRNLGRSADASQELSIFQRLQAQKDKDFRSRLESLLTGRAPSADEPR